MTNTANSSSEGCCFVVAGLSLNMIPSHMIPTSDTHSHQEEILSKHQEEEELVKKTVALTCQNRTSKERSKNCSGAGSTPEGRKYVTLKGMLQGDFKFKSSVFFFVCFSFFNNFRFLTLCLRFSKNY